VSLVRTVLGDIDRSLLGAVDYHEHLFQVTPLLVGDELVDEARSGAEAALLSAAGIGTMVEATPSGLGRDPAAVRRIAERIDMHIVQTTGLHHGGHYAADSPLLEQTAEQLTARFVRDIQDGFAETAGDARPVRAGLVKAGIRYWAIGPFERRALAAAAATAHWTGVAVMVHLDFGSATHEVLDLLAADGLAPDRVVLAHADRNLDPGLHSSIAERGAYLGYDGMARHREGPDSAILECLAAVAARGHADRVILGGDVARSRRYIAYGGMPGLAYLPNRFFPRVREVLSAEDAELVIGRNAARLLALDERNT